MKKRYENRSSKYNGKKRLKNPSGKNGLTSRKKDKGRTCKKRAMEYQKNKIVVIGEIVALYPHVFIAEMQGKRGKIKESFTYSQIITREVRLA